MKTILVPTDFSKNAYSALYCATQLFAEEPCKFVILHSFEDQVTNLTSRIDIGKTEAVVEELYTASDAKCDALIERINLDAPNDAHYYTATVTSLSLASAINKLIVKEQAHFVVMGSKGSTGANDILVGSNAMMMVQKIQKAPLLIIPADFVCRPILNIAFATGFKRAYLKSELRPLVYLASLSNATIKVLHVHKKEKMTEDQRANFHDLFNILRDSQPESNWLPNDSDHYDAITSFIKKEQTDLLAMIYYKHNAIVRLFREATVQKISKYSKIPFLILPARD